LFIYLGKGELIMGVSRGGQEGAFAGQKEFIFSFYWSNSSPPPLLKKSATLIDRTDFAAGPSLYKRHVLDFYFVCISLFKTT
jgi:hypothetical protein